MYNLCNNNVGLIINMFSHLILKNTFDIVQSRDCGSPPPQIQHQLTSMIQAAYRRLKLNVIRRNYKYTPLDIRRF